MKPLAPLGYLYGSVMALRNAMYDRGILRSHSLGAKTISIGNLTTGGTGKTPIVCLTAEILAEHGEKVCILTRGYGRKHSGKRVLVSDGNQVLADAATGGDEPVELARKLIGKAVVVADADRVAAAEWARGKFGVTAFVLDDGFQHRRAQRSIDIVCIDATDPFGGGVLPAGRSREPWKGLLRADAVIITRADIAADLDEIRANIKKLDPALPIFQAVNSVMRITPLKVHLEGRPLSGSINEDWKRLRNEGRPDNPDEEVVLGAFCALGNPTSFFAQIDAEFEKDSMDEFNLGAIKRFPDHHFYSQADIDELESWARKGSVDVLLTTAKDAVKLAGLNFRSPCYVVEIEPVIDRMDEFKKLVTSS